MKIKELISALKDNATIDKEYTLDEVFEDCNGKIKELKNELETLFVYTNVECAKFLLDIEKQLQEQQGKLFRKCCGIKGIEESRYAFCVYRKFLETYNDTIVLYNNTIIGKFNEDIDELTYKILEVKKRLLPINNENIECHTEYHQHNEPYYKEIEVLEKQRRQLLHTLIEV